MKLTDEQKLVMKESVKIYLVPEQRMGKVHKVTSEMLTLNIGTTKEPQYIKFTPKEYESKIAKEEVVLQKRVIWGKNGQYAGVKPLDNPPVHECAEFDEVQSHVIEPAPSNHTDTPEFLCAVPFPEVGYLNRKTKRFSLTPKDNYVRIEFREVKTKRVSLDLTDAQIELLEEMGIKG